jgi:glycosyltransferase involved in cell wall biosynthesis
MAAGVARVLFVSASLGGGGAERFVATVLRHLDRHRFAPQLCLFRRDLAYGLPEDVPLAVLAKRHPWDIPLAIGKLARLIDTARPDVVLSAFAHPNFVTGSALLLCRRRPRWVARVSNDPQRGESGAPRRLMRRLYRRAERILANSSALAEAVAEAYPALAGRVTTLPNATDFEQLDALAAATSRSRTAGLALLAVGRLTRQKRVDLMIEALRRLPEPRAELSVLGEGPLRGALERHAARLGLTERVHFEGFQTNPYARMATSDIFVLASDYEGLPNAMIEAQGLGLPAVATDCRYGPSEIVDPGVSGLLVPTGDAAALAAALARLAGDPELRRAMGRAARDRVRGRYAAGPVVRALEGHLAGSGPA